MTASEGSERRRYPRIDIKIPVEVDIGGGPLEAISVNLSINGVYCLLNESIEEFSQAVLHLNLPVTTNDNGTEQFRVETPAVAVRVENAGDRVAAAFMFREMPIEAEWVVGKFVLEHLDGIQQETAGQ